ncbi:MAG TPA: fibronectin type III domain-containing protein, partial [Streptosporangiaceae bacterium]|nr:fibronectin type III domain-containing protein [Streptosporangiaceae bacterium]
MVEVGGAGYISVTNTSSGTTDAAVTILGYVQDSSSSNAGETFAPLPYGGVLDTRSGYGAPQAQIPSGGSVTVQVAGTAGVPSDAVGAALYLGAANASASGWITAFATGTSDPGLRVLSYTPGQIVRNLFYGNLSSSGQITLVNHGAQPVDLMAAVQGYLVGTSASEAGDTYSDVPIQRIADTRNGTGGVPAEPVAAGGSITFSATGVDGVPASGVDAVVQTVAASNPTATGFLSVYPAGGADPGNSAVNFNSGDAQDADLTAPLVSSVSPTGEVTVTNHSSGTVDVIVSIRGYYTAPTAPPAPVLVDAGQSGTIATVTWSPPATDGGAAITSYTATLYNADGSVNSSTSTDPTADNMSFPGLSESDSYTVGVTATNAVGTSGSGTATVNVVPEGWEAPSIDELDYSSDWDIDPTTGDLTYDDGSSDTMIFSPDGTMTSD